RIIVPVFLEPNEDPTDMVASASFRPLVAVLQGLRSHDERIVVVGQEYVVKLGVFVSNSKSRRGKLTADKLATLAGLGLEWAKAERAAS
ncbi:hypothetical protein ACFWVP_34645, partial [Streptomyces sp. NPDC058637]|uniref:hypothetical protein n=1 Tax=Streptomyces sp. NPDC058637 TaxID=3346569 RepID=UPI003652DDB5